MAFTDSIVWFSGYFSVDNEAKVAESFVEHFLVNLRIKITDKEIGANILGSFILRGFIDFDGFTEHFDHMHDLDGIIGIILTFELNKAVSLVLIGDFISGKMNVNNGSALNKEFPEETLSDFLIKIADVDGSLLVAFVERGDLGHGQRLIKRW